MHLGDKSSFLDIFQVKKTNPKIYLYERVSYYLSADEDGRWNGQILKLQVINKEAKLTIETRNSMIDMDKK